MQILINILKGMIIGVANVIPGVSGGTMAVVMGIYDPLIYSINHLRNDLKKNIIFLSSIAIGAGIGILIFSRVILYLFDNFPMQTNFMFIGLILGGCPLIFKKATETKFKVSSLIPFFLALVLLIWMSLMKGDKTVVFQSDQPIIMIFLFFIAGVVSAAAMIIPGVSGSFILVLMGLYETIMVSIKQLDVSILVPLAIGIVIGGLLALRIIEKLLKNYSQQTFMAILGLVLGSIFAIYPGFSFDIKGLMSILLMLIGIIIAYLMSKE